MYAVSFHSLDFQVYGGLGSGHYLWGGGVVNND